MPTDWSLSQKNFFEISKQIWKSWLEQLSLIFLSCIPEIPKKLTLNSTYK